MALAYAKPAAEPEPCCDGPEHRYGGYGVGYGGYRRGYGGHRIVSVYPGGYYGRKKRSADPEPVAKPAADPEPCCDGPEHRYGGYGVGYGGYRRGYGGHRIVSVYPGGYYGRKKRSADPEPVAKPAADPEPCCDGPEHRHGGYNVGYGGYRYGNLLGYGGGYSGFRGGFGGGIGGIRGGYYG